MAAPDRPSRELIALSSGATITTVRDRQPGPSVSLLGGVHGDEDEDVLAVLRMLGKLRDAELTGAVNAVAIANPAAWAEQSRVSPLDGGNLVRCFPGKSCLEYLNRRQTAKASRSNPACRTWATSD